MKMLSRSAKAVFGACLLSTVMALSSMFATAQTRATPTITIFAAASLKNALDEAAAAFTQDTGTKTNISYAASSALAKQIEQAAPADVFISADLDWMDYLASKGLIVPETRANLVGNRLVVIAGAGSDVKLEAKVGFGLADAIGIGKLAIGDVRSVPAGRYAKAALEQLKVWDAVEPKLAQTENVRAALALVARGEALLGIVYETDAKAEPNVKIITALPETSHAPIVYPIAVTKGSAQVQAGQALIGFLRSSAAMDVFAKHGFKRAP